MTTIEVWDETRAREAVPSAGPASAEILWLLAIDQPAPIGFTQPRSQLGDALAVIAKALRLSPRRAVLASAEIAETAGESNRVGDVFSRGDVMALASKTQAASNRITLVADSSDPRESMAERLRAVLDMPARRSIVGVISLGEAADLTFDLTPRATAGDLVFPAHRDRAAERLFERTLIASRLVVDWELIAAVAIGLLRHLDAEATRKRFELTLVRDIARRHTGVTAPITWPEPSDLQHYAPETQFTILAHVVQSATDGDWTLIPDYARSAREALGVAGGEAGLKLLGAIGRALAANGDFDAARDALEGALTGWISTSPGQASYCLCELLRIEGIFGRLNRIAELRRDADKLWPMFDPASRSHVNLAIGRALAQAGRGKEALEVLSGDSSNPHAVEHVQTAAHRWRAVAARSVHLREEATGALAILERLGKSDQYYLAVLDAEVSDVAEIEATLNALLALPEAGDEVRRMLGRIAPGLSSRAIAERPATLRQLRAEYRY